MKFFWNNVAAAVVIAYLLTVGQAAEQPRPAKSQAPGTFQVKVSQGYLSLEAAEAPLGQIFQEIGKQAKITFDSNIGPEEKVTIRLDRVPLEEGIKRLAKNVTVFYTETPKDKSRRISRVVVLSEGRTQPETGKESAPQAVKINKPAAQPEPFKFEFDPGKFAEKEKPRKQP
ncbi:MAG: hypothetical protein ACXW6K_14660 [Candidatus Binatia bacterium]